MFVAARVQCASRRANLLAEFRYEQWLIEMFLNDPVESSHDRRVVSQRRPVLMTLAAKASHQGFNQRLFQSVRCFGMC
jgi:hypothetical protein